MTEFQRDIWWKIFEAFEYENNLLNDPQYRKDLKAKDPQVVFLQFNAEKQEWREFNEMDQS